MGQQSQCPPIGCVEREPLWRAVEYVMDHKRVDGHERRLLQVQAQRLELLVGVAVSGDVALAAVADEPVPVSTRLPDARSERVNRSMARQHIAGNSSARSPVERPHRATHGFERVAKRIRAGHERFASLRPFDVLIEAPTTLGAVGPGVFLTGIRLGPNATGRITVRV